MIKEEGKKTDIETTKRQPQLPPPSKQGVTSVVHIYLEVLTLMKGTCEALRSLCTLFGTAYVPELVRNDVGDVKNDPEDVKKWCASLSTGSGEPKLICVRLV